MRRSFFILTALLLAVTLHAAPGKRGKINQSLNKSTRWGYVLVIVPEKNLVYFYKEGIKTPRGLYDYAQDTWVQTTPDFKKSVVVLDELFIKENTPDTPPVTDTKTVEEIDWSLNNTEQFGYLIEILKEKDNPHIRFYTTKTKRILAIWDYQAKKWIIKDKDFKEAAVDLRKFYKTVSPATVKEEIDWSLNNTEQFGYLIEILQEKDSPHIRFYTTKTKRILAIWDYKVKRWIYKDSDFKENTVDISRFYKNVHPAVKKTKIKRAWNNTVQFGYWIEIKPEGTPQIHFLTTKSRRMLAIYDYQQGKWLIQDKDFKADQVDLEAFFEEEQTPPAVVQPQDKKPELTDTPAKKHRKINKKWHNQLYDRYTLEILDTSGKTQILFYMPKSRRLMAVYDYEKEIWVQQEKDFDHASIQLHLFYLDDSDGHPDDKPGELKPFKPKLNNK